MDVVHVVTLDTMHCKCDIRLLFLIGFVSKTHQKIMDKFVIKNLKFSKSDVDQHETYLNASGELNHTSVRPVALLDIVSSACESHASHGT